MQNDEPTIEPRMMIPCLCGAWQKATEESCSKCGFNNRILKEHE